MAKPTKIHTPLAARLEDFRRGPLTVIVWLGALSLALLILSNADRKVEFVGVVRGVQHEVSSASSGQIKSLLFDLYEPVEAGEVIARLDSGAVEAEHATALARVDQLRAEVDATRARYADERADNERGWEKDLRRFAVDEYSLRVDLLEQAVQLGVARVRSERYEAEQAKLRAAGKRLALRARRLGLRATRATALQEEGLISQSELDEMSLEHEEARQSIAVNEAELSVAAHRLRENRRSVEEGEQVYALLEDELAAAISRREQFAARAPDARAEAADLDALQRSIEVQHLAAQQLELAWRQLTIRAPISGTISTVSARPGQAVLVGETIVTIAARTEAGVIIHLPERNIRDLEEGALVRVARGDRPSETYESRVLLLAPEVSELPLRLWQNAAVPEYGRSLLLAPVHALDLLPGELVRVLREETTAP